jgi:hypothetical protein
MSDRVEDSNNRRPLAQGELSERELLQLFAAVCDDALTDEEGARFAELLESNPAIQQRYIEYIHLDTNLRYECSDLVPQETGLPSERSALFEPAMIKLPTMDGPAAPMEASSSPPGGVIDSLLGVAGSWIPVACRSTAFGMVACAFLGAATATWIVVQMARHGAFVPSRSATIVQSPDRDDAAEGESYVATLVNATNCRWDRSRSTIDFQGRGGLKPGQAMHLLEGVAQVNSKLSNGAVAEFQLEGPLALVLTSEGMPNLQFGRLMASFRSDYDRFTLDTPLGRVMVSGDASIGIVAAANDVELHVFSGMAMFEYWSNGIEPFPDQLKTTVGASLRARVAADGSLTFEHGKARESRFATATNIGDSRLVISESYIKAVRQAKPLGYWRFEGEEGGVIRNEMADRFHCRIVGDSIRLNSGPGNRCAEFGSTAGPGYLFSDDVIDAVEEAYTAEAWVKPSFYHHATLFSLVEPNDSLVHQHRFLLELCGPGPGQPTVRPWEAHPNQVRYLHRGTNRRGPSQCYSPAAYSLRKWQHIVITKEKSELQLFVDGDHVASAKDRNPLGKGLHVLIGQLYPKDSRGRDVMQARQFVGQLDEVAFYDRALSTEEIKEHFHSARPETDNTSPDS